MRSGRNAQHPIRNVTSKLLANAAVELVMQAAVVALETGFDNHPFENFALLGESL